eukprot:CAMPEP_0119133690 /NCGR_PEP_ID=MMETSP1310-20130426/13505_1 /TAXON_ID=464262 /ORGANISM="Genus nov. species nov., Strain RCC2339" /LENGTH=103 /DNA_ID=CAMNT_0007124391 /DNA_START=64 /DNA_END=372 /DNA_ORIENTATION=+
MRTVKAVCKAAMEAARGGRAAAAPHSRARSTEALHLAKPGVRRVTSVPTCSPPPGSVTTVTLRRASYGHSIRRTAPAPRSSATPSATTPSASAGILPLRGGVL